MARAGGNSEFGLFVQGHVPNHEVAKDPVNAEHDRLMRERDLAIDCDRNNFKDICSVEHHFLEEYSHISASEVFLPYGAGRTERIHIGSTIWNLTPPVNHPALTVERVAMLDHLSNGLNQWRVGARQGGQQRLKDPRWDRILNAPCSAAASASARAIELDRSTDHAPLAACSRRFSPWSWSWLR